MSLKNPVTPPGIDPGTVRLVRQRLNHYATPGSTTGLGTTDEFSTYGLWATGVSRTWRGNDWNFSQYVEQGVALFSWWPKEKTVNYSRPWKFYRSLLVLSLLPASYSFAESQTTWRILKEKHYVHVCMRIGPSNRSQILAPFWNVWSNLSYWFTSLLSSLGQNMG